MKLGNELRVAAPRAVVWEALNDLEVLKQCVPGCEQLERVSDTELRMAVTTSIGPVRSRFAGTLVMSNVRPLEGYTLTGRVQGGAVGFAQGAADVSLRDDADATLLQYAVDSTVGGKLAQIGSRLVEGSAAKLADQFFGCLERAVAAKMSSPAAASAQAIPEAAPQRRHSCCSDAPRELNLPGPAGESRGMNANPPRRYPVTLQVNGSHVSRNVEARSLLVEFLREELELTGTHVGCDTSQCGACTVLLDGRAIKSCTCLTATVDGCSVTTIEGLVGRDQALHPMQAAFKARHGLQCGFCTPGMVMSALEIVRRFGVPTERQAREALGGNLCRCTGYHGIVEAVLEGAAAMCGNGHV
jgi:aerobic carbon-monoxide dehydrogenase small subunit